MNALYNSLYDALSAKERKRVESMKKSYVSLLCREILLIGKIYRLKLRLERISQKEAHLTARRLFLSLLRQQLVQLYMERPCLFTLNQAKLLAKTRQGCVLADGERSPL